VSAAEPAMCRSFVGMQAVKQRLSGARWSVRRRGEGRSRRGTKRMGLGFPKPWIFTPPGGFAPESLEAAATAKSVLLLRSRRGEAGREARLAGEFWRWRVRRSSGN
jgi:hypothetical protein